jgi:ribonucleoside-diphosphate reductase alpha chain
MDISNQILSDITIFNKYAKYNNNLKRRETWDEICNRYENMMISKYPKLHYSILSNMKLIRDKKVLPSMRALQFAGPAISKNESRIYNCAFLPVDHYKSFAETMFLLLGGTGVGYSVQKQHIDKLNTINKPLKERKYVISDSLEGWADAIKVLMKAYIGGSQYKPKFNYSDIRAKGARLITAGGKAPGPRPLMECIGKITALLESKDNGSKLTPLECHDIQCHIANAVLSGGIRRSAMIALFSHDDNEMLTCKYGNWWEGNEQRGRKVCAPL